MSPKRQETHETWPLEQVIHLQILPVPKWKLLPFGSIMQGEFLGECTMQTIIHTWKFWCFLWDFRARSPQPKGVSVLFLNLFAFLHLRYLWGTEGYTVYTWAKLAIFHQRFLAFDSFVFEMGGSGPPVHQRQSLKVTCVDTRMDFQHKVEHPKVSRNRGFCSDLDQGDVKDEIYHYVSLVFMNFMERPVWNPSLSCMVWTWFCTEIHVNHRSIWFEQTYRGR